MPCFVFLSTVYLKLFLQNLKVNPKFYGQTQESNKRTAQLVNVYWLKVNGGFSCPAQNHLISTAHGLLNGRFTENMSSSSILYQCNKITHTIGPETVE